MESIIISIVGSILTCSTVVTYVLYRKAEKRIKNADAATAEANADKAQLSVAEAKYELYEKRLAHCNEIIEQHNTTLQHQSETIANLNKALDDKTVRIRELTDELYQSEVEQNQLNTKLVDVTRENGDLRERIAKLAQWRCLRADCDNGIPPRHRLRGQTFDDTVLEGVEGKDTEK